jgi:uroporphyrin-3 C-methyltransferase
VAAAAPPDASPPASAPPAPAAATQLSAARPPAQTLILGLAVLAVLLAIAATALSWRAQERARALELELVKRQQEVQQQAAEARLLSQQTQEAQRETVAKLSLLEARLSEVAVQRSQLEDLIQSLSRSRDENIVVDIDAGLRVAQQQSAISGSAEPLVAALRQADERLARYNQPRLEGVRRAIARDLDRVRKAAVADIGSLVIRLDEAVRMVDELPLLSMAEPREPARAAEADAGAASAAAAASAPASGGWAEWTRPAAWQQAVERAWTEVRSLVRVTRIARPESVLMAPEQAFFLRENLKLRLLNARLALLSRQFDTVQSDLQTALGVIDRYHDRSSRRTQLAQELLRQVAAQARQGGVPRPDDTLAALAAAAAGR